jgi:hypothetical protein
MPLDHIHQMQLLKDLLEDHDSDAAGTVAEYEQIERTVKSLLADESIDESFKAVLMDVYEYGQKGKNTNRPESHIQNHRERLAEWIGLLGQISE